MHKLNILFSFETMKPFNNLKQLEQTFKTQEDCLVHYESIRWANGIYCPHCESVKYYKLKAAHQYRCANSKCRKTFNVLHKTIFENTKIPLSTWFTAIYLATSHKKGISSHQLARDLGITQKTAWFICHRIREMLKEKSPIVLQGEVEIDETVIGGRDEFKHEYKRSGKQGKYRDKKMAVIGMVERGGKLFCGPIKQVHVETVHPMVINMVKPNSILHTDRALVYRGLKSNYTHNSVNHSIGEYVRDRCHTNTIEGAWSLFKRGIVGIYHHVSPKHLGRYCNEFAFRYNTRTYNEENRFNQALLQSGCRILYKELVSGE